MASNTVQSAPLQSGRRGQPVQLVTNLSRLALDESKEYYMYDVEVNEFFVKGDGTSGRRPMLETKVDGCDFLDQRRKRTIIALFQNLLHLEPDFFNKAKYHIYDREALFYTMDSLQMDHSCSRTFDVLAEVIPDVNGNVTMFTVTFQPARTESGEHVKVLASDINSAITAHSNKSIVGVLNLAVSQQPFFDIAHFRSYKNGCHYRIKQPGQTEGFDVANDFPSLGEGKLIGVGVSEAVKLLDNGVPYVVADVKKSAFHRGNIPLWDKIFQIFQNQRFNPANPSPDQKTFLEKQLKGLFAITSYRTKANRTQHVCISAIGAPANTIKVMNGPNEVTMVEYYRLKYQIELQHADCFTVMGRPGFYFPVELLLVGVAQRVKAAQQTPEMVATMIKASAMKPADRLRQTRFMKNEIGLQSNSVRLNEYGLTVADDLEMVNGRVLPQPSVIYGQDQNALVQNNCKWMVKGKYVNPATVASWAVVAFVSGRDDALGPVMNEFVKRFVQQCNSHGMNIGEPGATWLHKEPSQETVKKVFAEAERNKFTFLFFISSDRVIQHDYIKYMEVSQQILTQEVRLSRVRSVVDRGQNQTLDNIVAKTNMKLGGLNHILQLGTAPSSPENQWINEKTRLIIGFDVMNPAKISNFETSNKDPFVLGWSANCSTHPHKFVGDYMYVKSRDEGSVMAALRLVIWDVLERFYQNRQHNNTNVIPTHVYAYFNGVSEGNWLTISTSYQAALSLGIADKFGSEIAHPKFTLLVCTKSHNERLYKKEITGPSSAAQNIAPGTVVDTKITSATAPEFYLNSHSAFQGTAKTPKYTVLRDDYEPRLSMDAHQGIAHALCYLHEIVPMTVSIPAPLLVADRCAKRGHNVYKASGRGASAEEANQLLTNSERAKALQGTGRSLVNERYNA